MLAMTTGLVSHSYTVTSLFPYAGYMVEHLGVAEDKDQAGTYSLPDSVARVQPNTPRFLYANKDAKMKKKRS